MGYGQSFVAVLVTSLASASFHGADGEASVLQKARALGVEISDCWAGDFNEQLCCRERWGLTGNPACWNEEFTYLRCCGLSALPRLPEEDAKWDEVLRTSPVEDAGEYDFIVVGAGSSGSVVAARLAASDGPDGEPWRVLLLDAGPWDQHEDLADPDQGPSASSGLWTDPIKAEWRFGTSKSSTWAYSTGRGLGGTAAVNSMIYTRGSISEYENFGWSPEEVLDAFKSLEAPMEAPGFTPQPGAHRPLAASESAQPHSVDKPGYHLTLVSATPDELPPLFRGLLKGFEAAGVPFRLDPHGSASIHGVGGTWRSMGCGHPKCQPTRVSRIRFARGRPRSTPYKTLVAPLNRTGGHRLQVAPHSTVERILFDENRAIGVEVSEGSGLGGHNLPRRRLRYKATREIVIAAGVFSSPKLLTLSGVAEPAELKRLSLSVVAASPSVSRHFQEHVGVSIVVGTNVDCPEGYHRTESGDGTHLGTTEQFIGQLYAFLNATDNTPGALGALDAEVMLLEGCLEEKLYLTFTIILLQSDTRGRLVVQSRNPFTAPHLDLQPLSHSRDIEVLANVIRTLYTKVLSSPAMSDFELGANPGIDVIADFQKLAQWIRANLYFYAHPTGTCRIQRDGAQGVVDSQLRVIGTKGLRVADASVLPLSPSGHSDAPSRLVGEMASRFIIRDTVSDNRREQQAPSEQLSVKLRGYSGVSMPLRGLGTNGFTGSDARDAVSRFLRLGGRMLDTALLYDNHQDVAAALAASGVPRGEVFLSSKVPPGEMGEEETYAAIQRAVSELGTYLDLVLIHWPSNFDDKTPVPACGRPPGGSWRMCRAAAWRGMERAHREGQVKSLGVSNFGVRHLTQLLDEPGRTLSVAVNQVELHPWWPQPALRKFCAGLRIALVAYGSLGGSLLGGATLRSPGVVRVAQKQGKSPAQVLLRWAVQQGVAVIPSSSSEKRIAQNFDVADFVLDDTDMELLSVGPQDRMRIYLPDPENAP